MSIAITLKFGCPYYTTYSYQWNTPQCVEPGWQCCASCDWTNVSTAGNCWKRPPIHLLFASVRLGNKEPPF